jgi:hypothetical protein
VSAAQEQLAPVDARAAVEAFEGRLNYLRAAAAPENREANTPNPVRERDRDHLRFVASQGCLICRRSPSDAHLTVPLCRLHHRELHRIGNEGA